jgi:hypothetical protein
MVKIMVSSEDVPKPSKTNPQDIHLPCGPSQLRATGVTRLPLGHRSKEEDPLVAWSFAGRIIELLPVDFPASHVTDDTGG